MTALALVDDRFDRMTPEEHATAAAAQASRAAQFTAGIAKWPAGSPTAAACEKEAARALERAAAHRRQAGTTGMTPEELAGAQTEEAVEDLHRDPTLGVAFPYAGVHTLVGRVMPERVVLVCANTGQGKTTFLLDVVERWTEQGVRVEYCGTEQTGKELRIKLACRRAGIPAGIAIGNEWAEYPHGGYGFDSPGAMREAVQAELAWMASGPYADRIRFTPEKFVDTAQITKAAKGAEKRGARVLVVDHLNRVDTSGSKNAFDGFTKLMQRFTEVCRDHGLVGVGALQMNRSGANGDPLARYRCPDLDHTRGGGSAPEEAHATLGLWRPIDPEAPKEMLKLAAARMAPASSILEPRTMAVGLLKHRTWGEREGQWTKLRIERGGLVDARACDDHRTGFDVNRPGTR